MESIADPIPSLTVGVMPLLGQASPRAVRMCGKFGGVKRVYPARAPRARAVRCQAAWYGNAAGR